MKKLQSAMKGKEMLLGLNSFCAFRFLSFFSPSSLLLFLQSPIHPLLLLPFVYHVIAI